MIQWLLDLIFSRGHNVTELARRLDVRRDQLTSVNREYGEFQIRKRNGKPRTIAAPNAELKHLQRRILRRLIARLKVHPQATGFQRGLSFVDNARCHQSQSIVIRIDLVDFFPSIKRQRIEKYFRNAGWNRKAARLLADLTTWKGELPQGAPTSPRLSNLVNYSLDARLAGLAQRYDGVYTRYADDIVISLSRDDWLLNDLIADLIRTIRQHGYRPHIKGKFDVRRSHQRQMVTGLVVNDRANLPRETRRWLRAVEHRTKVYRAGGTFCLPPTLTAAQLQGWHSLRQMIDRDQV
ncbi:MAG: reverse transcriptase family protein [Pirellulaceae bacterium]